MSLTPKPGIVPFTPNVSFWSDYAQKQRWFSIPDITKTITFDPAGNWTFPNSTIWIKQFNLPNERTNPTGPSRRIETRFLVKDGFGTYGLTYKWRESQTEADLVDPNGEDVPYTVLVNGTPTKQVWQYPARYECVRCHTDVAGIGLGFNTWQMNAPHVYGSQTLNQIQALSDAGYFSAHVNGVNNLPAFTKAYGATPKQSLEWRVRSFLASNCIQCHQPGGEGKSIWDARPTLSTDDAQLINGQLNASTDPDDRFAVPGDTSHSMVLKRLLGIGGYHRMPPLATNELDPDAIQLFTEWITQDLPTRLSFAQWQTQFFTSTKNPNAAPDADPDHDGHKNIEEYLANTDPLHPASAPTLPIGSIISGGTQIQFLFTQPANCAVVAETSTDLSHWTVWDIPGNSPSYPADSQLRTITTPVNLTNLRHIRIRLSKP